MKKEKTSGSQDPASGCTGLASGAGRPGLRGVAPDGIVPGWSLALAVTLLVAGGVQAAAAQAGQAAPADDELGRQVYEANCAQCHGSSGQGIPGVYPALDGDPFVTSSAELPVQVVLEGRAPAPDTPPMPGFGDLLSDEEIAAVVSYIRGHWSNEAEPVRAESVAELRSRLAAEEEKRTVEMPAGWRQKGEEIYQGYCAACHQEQGEGAEGIFPELAGNPLVTSAPGPLVHVLLTGRGGMPNFSRQLDDEELSYVLSYIRGAWGNEAPPISPQMVREVPHPEGGH